MQIRICCVSLLVATVLAQYRNEHYDHISNSHNRWGNSYGIPARYPASHETQKTGQLRKGWPGFYGNHPTFFSSRFHFVDFPPLHDRPTGGQHHIREYGIPNRVNFQLTRFQDWRQQAFGPPKRVELFHHEHRPEINKDSKEVEGEIAPFSNDDEAEKVEDFTSSKEENTTVNVDEEEKEEEEGNSSKEKETEDEKQENSEEDDEAHGHDEESKFQAEETPDKSSDEDEVINTQPEVNIDPLDANKPDDAHHWDSPFDYFSNDGGGLPANNSQQSDEVHDAVIFSTSEPTFKFWNSEDLFPPNDDDSFEWQKEDDELSLAPVSSPTLGYKYTGSSFGHISVYKHNYRKLPIVKNGLQTQIDID